VQLGVARNECARRCNEESVAVKFGNREWMLIDRCWWQKEDLSQEGICSSLGPTSANETN